MSMRHYAPSEIPPITPIHGDRVIRDCERDVKGKHEWKYICESGECNIFWCLQCGAIGDSRSSQRPNPKIFGRVKEKSDV